MRECIYYCTTTPAIHTTVLNLLANLTSLLHVPVRAIFPPLSFAVLTSQATMVRMYNIDRFALPQGMFTPKKQCPF